MNVLTRSPRKRRENGETVTHDSPNEDDILLSQLNSCDLQLATGVELIHDAIHHCTGEKGKESTLCAPYFDNVTILYS